MLSQNRPVEARTTQCGRAISLRGQRYSIIRSHFQRIGKSGGIVRRHCKTAIRFADQFRREIEIQAEIRESRDAKEGRAAFVEKRAARFTGE